MRWISNIYIKYILHVKSFLLVTDAEWPPVDSVFDYIIKFSKKNVGKLQTGGQSGLLIFLIRPGKLRRNNIYNQ